MKIDKFFKYLKFYYQSPFIFSIIMILEEYSIWIEENLYNMWVVDAVDSF